MANIKLLQEAIQAFANGESEIADKKMRKYFVEQAQEINKKLEEEMDSEEDLTEDEELDEDIDTDPEQSMTNETGYKLSEDEDLDEDFQGGDMSGGDFGSQDQSGQMQTEEDESYEVEDESSVPSGDEWEKIKDAFAGLERMFDEINDAGADFDDAEDDFEDAEDDEFGSDDDFDDVGFGSDKVGEAFQMKKVSEPEKTEKSGVNKKSVVAPNAKSPVDGVKAVKIKDGSVDATDDKFENSDALDAKVEDHNNVMDNAKHVLKPAKTPKNTAEKSKSVLPANKPKF